MKTETRETVDVLYGIYSNPVKAVAKCFKLTLERFSLGKETLNFSETLRFVCDYYYKVERVDRKCYAVVARHDKEIFERVIGKRKLAQEL